jgi:hypothetical protein
MARNQRKTGLAPTVKETMLRDFLECPLTNRALFNHVCGDLLGWGASRSVFEYMPNKKYVVKIEHDDTKHNTIEWHYWQMVKDTIWAKWFAPCKEISTCGSILIQEKARLLKPGEGPDKIPYFFTDTKYQNFGWIKEQLVCVDYSTCLLSQVGLTNRMKPAKWWDHPNHELNT